MSCMYGGLDKRVFPNKSSKVSLLHNEFGIIFKKLTNIYLEIRTCHALQIHKYYT